MAMMDLSDSTDRFLSSLTVNGASRNTVRAYRADLKGLLSNATTPQSTPNRTTIETLAAEHLTELRQTYSPNTVNRKLACFRKFGRFMGWPDFLAEYRPPKAAKGVAHPLPEGVDGISAMLEVADKPDHKALVALCGLLGVRVGEALQVRPSHFNMDRNMLRVHGKGDKQRDIYVADSAWIHLMGAIIVCRENDDLLVPLHDRSARRVWTRLANKAGLHHSSTHDGRMTVGTLMYYKSGGDIRAVQEHLGHSSSTTTENYTQVNAAKLKHAVDILGGD